jgi:hypothetical protein
MLHEDISFSMIILFVDLNFKWCYVHPGVKGQWTSKNENNFTVCHNFVQFYILQWKDNQLSKWLTEIFVNIVQNLLVTLNS